MTWQNLAPSLILLVLWLAKALIDTRLQKSVQSEYDRRLAALNSELRKTEESFKADLKTKELAIQSLQGSLLASIAQRRAITDKRQIEAVDQLWGAMHSLGSAKVAAQWMSGVKFEAASKEAARNKDFRKLFEVVKMPDEAIAEALELAAKSRPHVSALSWAYFAAWKSVVMHSVVQLKMMQNGVDAPDVLNSTSMINAVKLALPHQAEYIDKYGASAGYHLLEELEAKLLAELQASLDGKTQDAASVSRARQIMAQVSETDSSPAELQQFGKEIQPPA